jgi:hypothetical protein
VIVIADPTQVQDAAGHESSHRDHAEDGAGGVLLAQDQDDELGGDTSSPKPMMAYLKARELTNRVMGPASSGGRYAR